MIYEAKKITYAVLSSIFAIFMLWIFDTDNFTIDIIGVIMLSATVTISLASIIIMALKGSKNE